MKRYCIYWLNDQKTKKCVEVIASNFRKALEYCEKNTEDFSLETVESVYTYDNVIIAE